MEKDTLEVQRLGACDPSLWSVLSRFSDCRFEHLAKDLETLKDQNPERKDIWHALFHACLLDGNSAMSEKIATQYSMKFGCMPPVYELPADTANNSGSKTGSSLKIQFLSKEESDDYGVVFDECLAQKKPLMLNFDIKKHNQLLGVTSEEGLVRLSTGIQAMLKKKIPIYFTGFACLEYLELLAPEKRSQGAWDLLFALLTLASLEEKFEEVAVDYAVLKGVSPPSWTLYNFPAPDRFFGGVGSGGLKKKEQILENGGVMMELTGHLRQAMDGLQDYLEEKKPSTLVLDLKMVPFSCWSSCEMLLELKKTMEKSQHRVMIMDLFPLVREMLFAMGWPENLIFSQKIKK